MLVSRLKKGSLLVIEVRKQFEYKVRYTYCVCVTLHKSYSVTLVTLHKSYSVTLVTLHKSYSVTLVTLHKSLFSNFGDPTQMFIQ